MRLPAEALISSGLVLQVFAAACCQGASAETRSLLSVCWVQQGFRLRRGLDPETAPQLWPPGVAGQILFHIAAPPLRHSVLLRDVLLIML